MSAPYLLTGATGFIGKRLAEQLISAGHTVIAIVRDPTKAGDLAQMGVMLHKGDVTDKESMRPAMQGCEGVFHVAGWYKLGVKDKTPGYHINVEGTRNVLELMQELKIPKGVYTSTLAVYSNTCGKMVDETYRYNGPFLSEYDRTKWLAHYEVAEPMMAQGLPLVIVQPGLVYGPGDTSSVRISLVQYLQRKLPMVPLGTGLCWSHVEDIARAHIQAMQKGRPGESYNISGPPHTLVDAFDLAERLTGIPAPKLHVSPEMMRLMSGMMGFFEKFLTLPEQYTAENLRVLAGSTYWASDNKARKELGFDPRPLEVGLKEILDHEMALLGIHRR